MSDDGRISRVTLPTASFTLTTQHIRWIAEEAERRGVSKSVLVREIFDRAIGRSAREAIHTPDESQERELAAVS